MAVNIVGHNMEKRYLSGIQLWGTQRAQMPSERWIYSHPCSFSFFLFIDCSIALNNSLALLTAVEGSDSFSYSQTPATTRDALCYHQRCIMLPTVLAQGWQISRPMLFWNSFWGPHGYFQSCHTALSAYV